MKCSNESWLTSHSALQIIWTANAHVAGALDIQAADGKRFQSHVLGLAFADAKSGASAFFATVKDCVGQVVGNTVTYPSAFDGLNADIVYIYSRAGMEQNIVLHEDVPDPSQAPWNMD